MKQGQAQRKQINNGPVEAHIRSKDIIILKSSQNIQVVEKQAKASDAIHVKCQNPLMK